MEAGRLGEVPGSGVVDLAEDQRWLLDSPSSAALFRSALALGWARDPFDRLLAAHALHRRWRLATGDRCLVQGLPAGAVLAL